MLALQTDKLQSSDSDRTQIFLQLSIIFLAISLFWIPRLTKSLDLDESVSFWIIKDSFHVIFDRVFYYHHQNPLYYLILWGSSKVFGISEWALRLPSFIAMLVTCYTLYEIGKILFDRYTALASLVIFVVLDEVVLRATSVRPYSFAMLWATQSMLSLVLWLGTGKLRYQNCYLINSVLTIYAHYFFGTILFVHAIYYLSLRLQEKTQIRFLRFITVLIALSLFVLIPNISHLQTITQKRHILHFALMPTGMDLYQTLFPSWVVCCLAMSYIVVRLVTRCKYQRLPTVPNTTYLFLLSWSFLPPTILYLVSHATGISVFVPRYCGWASPGFALLASGFIRTLGSAKCRSFLLISFFCFAMVIREKVLLHETEDWKHAVEKIAELNRKPEVPILAYTGLVESQDLDWVIDSEKQSYFLSPFSYYLLPHPPIPFLPWSCPKSENEKGPFSYLRSILEARNHLFLIARLTVSESADGNKLSTELSKDCLSGYGFKPVNTYTYSTLEVIEFKRAKEFLS